MELVEASTHIALDRPRQAYLTRKNSTDEPVLTPSSLKTWGVMRTPRGRSSASRTSFTCARLSKRWQSCRRCSITVVHPCYPLQPA